MTLNSAGQSFINTARVFPISFPRVSEPSRQYSNLTTAQCAANGALTAVSVTSAITPVEAAKVRTNGITIIVPIDQPQVTFGANNTGANAIQAIAPSLAGGLTPTFAPSSGGFALPPGTGVVVDPFNDAMYAVTPTGVTATIYFIDP